MIPAKTAALLTEFNAISKNPHQWVKYKLDSSEQLAIGYFCSYVPIELVHAAGILPIRILGDQELSPAVDAHLQSYCCFYAKSALGLLLENQLNFLCGVIFAHSCDTMQCLADIWELNSRLSFHYNFNMPTKLDDQAAFLFTKEQIFELKSVLENLTNQKISKDKLTESIHTYNTSRNLMRELYQLKRNFPAILSNSSFFDIVRAYVIMPPEAHANLLKQLLDLLSSENFTSVDTPRLFITGAMCSDPNLHLLIDELNGCFVGDDICVGYREIVKEVELSGDPMESLAKSLVARVPCPCKLNCDFDRGNFLVNRVREDGADGVIFYLQKYCDPFFYDHPYLKRKLEQAGIPSILIETEKPGSNLSQIKNRLQAFLEMIA